MGTIGRVLVIAGGALLVIGLAVLVLDRLGVPLGRLPGDLNIERRGVRIHVPLVTSLIVSIILTVLINLFWRRP
jgi:hypothetical protein